MRGFAFAVSLSVCVSVLHAQTPTVTKDAQAVAVAQRSIAAMRGPSATLSAGELGTGAPDSIATGTLILHAKNVKEGNTVPIVLKTRGTNRVRLELQRPSGTTVRILNNGRGTMQRPDGSVRRLLMNNTYGERVSHIPAFSLLAENQAAAVELQRLPERLVGGEVLDSIALAVVPTADPEQAPHFRAQTRTTFEIQRASGLVIRMEYPLAAENDANVVQQVQVEFTDYRTVDGIAVPFRQKSYADGKLEAELVLDSVSFKVQLDDSEFELAKGGRE